MILLFCDKINQTDINSKVTVNQNLTIVMTMRMQFED
jgi:hypothetical protein